MKKKEKCKTKAPSTRIRFHIVFIKTTNFSLHFHLAPTRKRLKMITFENGLKENNMKMIRKRYVDAI